MAQHGHSSLCDFGPGRLLSGPQFSASEMGVTLSLQEGVRVGVAERVVEHRSPFSQLGTADSLHFFVARGQVPEPRGYFLSDLSLPSKSGRTGPAQLSCFPVEVEAETERSCFWAFPASGGWAACLVAEPHPHPPTPARPSPLEAPLPSPGWAGSKLPV